MPVCQVQIKGGARERRIPSGRIASCCRHSPRRVWSKWRFSVRTTTAAISTGTWQIWHSRQSSKLACAAVRWPACGMWCVHSTQANSWLNCSWWTWRDVSISIGRNTANNTLADIFRRFIVFTDAKVQTFSHYCWFFYVNVLKKCNYLVVFPYLWFHRR